MGADDKDQKGGRRPQEARLAEALRANLRRRRATGRVPAPKDPAKDDPKPSD